MSMHKDISILPALWTPTTVNTAPQRISCTVRQTDTTVDIRLQEAEDAPAVISVRVLCAWIAFAAVWDAVKI